MAILHLVLTMLPMPILVFLFYTFKVTTKIICFQLKKYLYNDSLKNASHDTKITGD